MQMARSGLFACVALCLMCTAAVADVSLVHVLMTRNVGQYRCDPERAYLNSNFKNGVCMSHPTLVPPFGIESLAQRIDCVSESPNSEWTWTFFEDRECTKVKDRKNNQLIIKGKGRQCTRSPVTGNMHSVDCSGPHSVSTDFPVGLLEPINFKCPCKSHGSIKSDTCVAVPSSLRNVVDSRFRFMRTICSQPSGNSRAVITFYTKDTCSDTGFPYVQDAYTSHTRERFFGSRPYNRYFPPLLANCAGSDDHSFDLSPPDFTVTLKACPSKHLGYVTNLGCTSFINNGVILYAKPQCFKRSPKSIYKLTIYSDPECENVWWRTEREWDPNQGGYSECDANRKFFVEC